MKGDALRTASPRNPCRRERNSADRFAKNFFGSGFLIFMRHEPSPAHRTEAKLLSLGRPIPGGANGNRNYPEIDERWTTGLKAFRETVNAI